MTIRLRYVLLSLVALATVVGVLFVAGLWSVKHTPTFYEEAMAADYETQSLASRELESRATALLSDVNMHDAWEAVFTDEQINGFLAVDLPEKHPKLLPKNMSDPRVAIDEGTISLASRAELGGVVCVYSMEIEVRLEEPNVVACRIASVRAGALPLPLKKVLDQISAACARLNIPIRWVQEDGDPVALLTISPDWGGDDRRIVIRSLEIKEGAIFVAGGTEDAKALDAQSEPRGSGADALTLKLDPEHWTRSTIARTTSADQAEVSHESETVQR